MERISELNTLIEYWKLQGQLANSEVRREIAIRQQRSFEDEQKVLPRDWTIISKAEFGSGSKSSRELDRFGANIVNSEKRGLIHHDYQNSSGSR
jgi:hypothetical protein